MSLSGRQAHVLQVFHSAALMIDHTGRCGARVTCAQQHVLQYAFYSLSCCVWVCPRTRIAYADIAARLMLHCAVRSRDVQVDTLRWVVQLQVWRCPCVQVRMST